MNGVFYKTDLTASIIKLGSNDLADPIELGNVPDINPDFFLDKTDPSGIDVLCTSDMSAYPTITLADETVLTCEAFGGGHPTDPPDFS